MPRFMASAKVLSEETDAKAAGASGAQAGQAAGSVQEEDLP